MKRFVGPLLFFWIALSSALAAEGPEVELVDNKLSITAESVSLARLIQLVDRATGMQSTVPAELGSRTVSVRFTNLDIRAAVRKMFEGQPVDYLLIPSRGIVVTSASQVPGRSAEVLQPFDPGPAPFQAQEHPFTQERQQAIGQLPQIQPQPATIQTPPGQIPSPAFGQAPANQQPATIQIPFGPIPNSPRAGPPGTPENQPQVEPTMPAGYPFGPMPATVPPNSPLGNSTVSPGQLPR
jgi:hypothetical protein